MASSHGYDFLFCDICGTMLSLNSPKYAKCPRCKLKRNVKEIAGKATSYTVTAEDIRRELNLEPFVQLDKISIEEAGVQRAVVNEACPLCKHPQLEYYTKQLRSADEGQTVFYECPKCRHKD
ncbi:DNA-directed RNA polymerase I subunit RPA12-like protein [Cinnamomum micranthum f. kanehirae]|uniref:DNA-directed RNA polymerase subunit n=1 Tax=Cinnamomum micranthum f. kanehirae TaxID=337451 RepID=A0A3S3MPJ9_9MAGN|nr:DNA-directed RNA polymerase I subunit RPA12-like protein [Cinnamomum micranthum f. kanehirae]